MKKILTFMTWIVFILFWASLMSIDSQSWVPFMVFIGCWIWLAIAAYKMGLFYDPERDEEDV